MSQEPKLIYSTEVRTQTLCLVISVYTVSRVWESNDCYLSKVCHDVSLLFDMYFLIFNFKKFINLPRWGIWKFRGIDLLDEGVWYRLVFYVMDMYFNLNIIKILSMYLCLSVCVHIHMHSFAPAGGTCLWKLEADNRRFPQFLSTLFLLRWGLKITYSNRLSSSELQGQCLCLHSMWLHMYDMLQNFYVGIGKTNHIFMPMQPYSLILIVTLQ